MFVKLESTHFVFLSKKPHEDPWRELFLLLTLHPEKRKFVLS